MGIHFTYLLSDILMSTMLEPTYKKELRLLLIPCRAAGRLVWFALRCAGNRASRAVALTRLPRGEEGREGAR